MHLVQTFQYRHGFFTADYLQYHSNQYLAAKATVNHLIEEPFATGNLLVSRRRKNTIKTLIESIFFMLLLKSFLLISPALSGAEITDLYTAIIAVADQSDRQRQSAIRTGLEQVIVRVTGTKNAIQDSYVQQKLANASEYLEQFNYLSADQVEPSASSASSSSEQKLRLKYDESLVKDMLRRARLPIWGSNRPSIVVWIAVEREGVRSVIGNYDDDEFTRALNVSAQQRGVPLVYPLMDLEDQVNLPSLDAWGLFKDRIEAASERYGADAILAGRTYQDAEGQWQWSWMFVFNEQSGRFNHTHSDVQQSISFALDTAADQLGAHYAISTSLDNRSSVSMWVEGINSLEDYDASLKYFDKLVAIRRVDLRTIVQDRILFEVHTDTSAEKLQEELALDNRLVFVAEGTLQPGIDETPGVTAQNPGVTPTLHYRWRSQ